MALASVGHATTSSVNLAIGVDGPDEFRHPIIRQIAEHPVLDASPEQARGFVLQDDAASIAGGFQFPIVRIIIEDGRRPDRDPEPPPPLPAPSTIIEDLDELVRQHNRNRKETAR